MSTITISNDITLTASEDTIKEYLAITEKRAQLHSWLQSSYEERDWQDYDDYTYEMWELGERMLRLGA